MPVLSPHRSSSSSLSNGTYRSNTFNTSSLERPFYGTSSASTFSPRFSTYSERYTSRTYADSDGRRAFSRTGSITEDGITTRFREDSRENSLRRDSLGRENSQARDSRESRLSAVNVVESVADLRNKYSPANYVPAVLRNKDLNRSKTLNDIGLPPTTNSFDIKRKVRDLTSQNNLNCGLNNSNTTNTDTNNTQIDDNMRKCEDTNGNRTLVAEMRKKFDANAKNCKTNLSTLVIEGSSIKIAENRFKKQDSVERSIENEPTKLIEATANKLQKTVKQIDAIQNNDLKAVNCDTDSDVVATAVINTDHKASKAKIYENAIEFRGVRCSASAQTHTSHSNHSASHTSSHKKEGEGVLKKTDFKKGNINNASSRVNNFASYIPNKGDLKGGENVNGVEMESRLSLAKGGANATHTIGKDITSPSRLNRINAPGGGSSQRNSLERDRALDEVDTPSNGTPTATANANAASRGRYADRTSPTKQLGLNGLKNIGNTCFMNSVLQCLSNTKPLMEYVKRDGHTADANTTTSSMKGALIKAFAQLVKELWAVDGSGVVNTVSLKSQIQRFAPRFMGYSQQDAQEFLRYLLEGLHEEVNRVSAKPTPIHTEIEETLSDGEKATESWQRYIRRENSKIVDIFVGQLKSTLKCTHCGHCSVTFDPFWDLSLPIPQKTGPIRLSQCLESFTREETLDGDEKPTCSKCKERRKCTKSFSIHKFPKILVIHLKRFSPTERFRGKLSVTVDFPLEGLDMSNYAAESHTSLCRYNLYAISNHSGTTYSGHYTAYCRHPYSMQWHEYNDSRVSSISGKSIVSGEAYVLFYELDNKMAHL